MRARLYYFVQSTQCLSLARTSPAGPRDRLCQSGRVIPDYLGRDMFLTGSLGAAMYLQWTGAKEERGLPSVGFGGYRALCPRKVNRTAQTA